MHHRAIYTRFPNLFDTAKTKSGTASLQAEWPVSVPQEILILSWASLLQSYTSIREPVFSFEGQAVQVNGPCGTWNVVEAEGLNERDDRHTSIALQPVGSGRACKQAVELTIASFMKNLSLPLSCGMTLTLEVLSWHQPVPSQNLSFHRY